jgi:hypothetical protein
MYIVINTLWLSQCKQRKIMCHGRELLLLLKETYGSDEERAIPFLERWCWRRRILGIRFDCSTVPVQSSFVLWKRLYCSLSYQRASHGPGQHGGWSSSSQFASLNEEFVSCFCQYEWKHRLTCPEFAKLKNIWFMGLLIPYVMRKPMAKIEYKDADSTMIVASEVYSLVWSLVIVLRSVRRYINRRPMMRKVRTMLAPKERA